MVAIGEAILHTKARILSKNRTYFSDTIKAINISRKYALVSIKGGLPISK